MTITPTYSGCPAMHEIAHDLGAAAAAGLRRGRRAHRARPAVDARDWITADGRRKLAGGRHRAAADRRPRRPGPVPLTLGRARRAGRLPALRLGRHQRAARVQRHRVQGAAPLPRLP